MTGFGNENNNENQDLGALNMGPESMFSTAPENTLSAGESALSGAPQQAFDSTSQQITDGVRPQVPQTPQQPQQPQPRAQAPQQPQTPQQRAPQALRTPQQPQALQAKAESKEENDDEVITVKPIRFASFENEVSAVGTPRKNLDIMQDVKARITVELGRCKMKVKKVLDIQKGSIIEINKVAGEQVELFVCGKLVAHGEVIVIEDKFGLRITSIIEDKTL